MGRVPPWTRCLVPVAPGAVRPVTFPDAIALQARGPGIIPGTELAWTEDGVGDAARTWAIDAPGELIPWGGAGKAEVRFPAQIPIEEPPDLELTAYHPGAAPVVHALARTYPEWQLLRERTGVNAPSLANTVLTTYQDASRTELAIERRRWSSVVVLIRATHTGPETDLALWLEIESPGPVAWRARSSVPRSGFNAREGWETETFLLGTRYNRVMAWPVPMARWRIRFRNDGGSDATLDYLIALTSEHSWDFDR